MCHLKQRPIWKANRPLGHICHVIGARRAAARMQMRNRIDRIRTSVPDVRFTTARSDWTSFFFWAENPGFGVEQVPDGLGAGRGISIRG